MAEGGDGACTFGNQMHTVLGQEKKSCTSTGTTVLREVAGLVRIKCRDVAEWLNSVWIYSGGTGFGLSM
jgi:hypothetical protein